MDMWTYYDRTHALHTFYNPISAGKVERLFEILDLPRGARVLDIACGQATMLRLAAERYGIAGVGVDCSPPFVARARRALEAQPSLDVTIVEERGENVDPAAYEPFDVVMLIGASWIWKGYEGTLDAMVRFLKPGGRLVIGEPHWREPAPAAYLEADPDLAKQQYFTLAENVEVAKQRGLRLAHMLVSSENDWDEYETRQLAAIDRFAIENPDHPDTAELIAKGEHNAHLYLTWGRRYFGFATFVFRDTRTTTE